MAKALLSSLLTRFYLELQPPDKLPKDVEVLMPFKEPAVQTCVQQFFRKFYADRKPRKIMLGINPGRLGGGITGINFTGPRQLTACGIRHPFGNSSELSAEFIYQVIDAYGGPQVFYANNYIGAVSPLGYTKNGKNLNYYDEPTLQSALLGFINDRLTDVLDMGMDTKACICIGGEKNYRFLSRLNEQRHKEGLLYFNQITPVPHPRFILQYRRRQLAHYISLYLDAIG